MAKVSASCAESMPVRQAPCRARKTRKSLISVLSRRRYCCLSTRREVDYVFHCASRCSNEPLLSHGCLRVRPRSRLVAAIPVSRMGCVSIQNNRKTRNGRLTSVVGVMTIPGSAKSVGTNSVLASIRNPPTVPLRLDTRLRARLTSSGCADAPHPPTKPLGPPPL